MAKLFLLLIMSTIIALSYGQSVDPPSYTPDVTREVADTIIIYDADYAAITPNDFRVLDGVQVLYNSLVWADADGLIRVRVSPLKFYSVRATIIVLGPDGTDPGTDPDPHYFHTEYFFPVTQEYRIQASIMMVVDGLREFVNLGANFFDFILWREYFTNRPVE